MVDGTVKLTDFGLARGNESKDITVTGFFVGTPFYVAPEQVEDSRKVDSRADLYSLGCVFFELLTGRVPYDGEHAWDVVMKHLNGAIPQVTALRPELPPTFNAFFQRALAKRPEQRFQTPDEFVAAADALLGPDRAGTRASPSGQLAGGDLAVRGVSVFVSTTSEQVFPLTAADMIIGRSDAARGVFPAIDLLPLDPSQTVSRRHARFTRRDGRCYIEDLNAYNRTRLNGEQLVPHQDVELHDGDTLRLGNIDLRFEARGR
jgi:serine/threonine-protein kinase